MKTPVHPPTRRPRPPEAGLLLVLGALLLAGGCATPADPARLEGLESTRRALDYRLQSMKSASLNDLRIRDMKRAALERAERLDQQALGGQEAFVAFSRSYLTSLFEAVLPFGFAKDGFRFAFSRSELELVPEGVRLKLQYTVEADLLRGTSDRPPEGQLVCRVTVERGPSPAGELLLQVEPELLEVDDRYYRAARVLQEKLTPASFTGLLPALPLPLGLPRELQWEGRRQQVEVGFDPARLLVLPDRIVLPFSLGFRPGAPVTPPAPGSAAPPPAPPG